MGEAFLHQSGSGFVYRSLSVTLPAPYNVFYNGMTIDKSKFVVTADLGVATFGIDPEDCTFSHDTATVGMTSITVSYKIRSVTRSAQVPIEVLNTRGEFDENPWEIIAEAAYYGFADVLWSVGDVKRETVNDVDHEWRIIGFNHDDLSSNDAYYNDPLYNRGMKKAAIAIQWKKKAGEGPMVSYEQRQSNIGWKECAMRTTTLPALLNSMPYGLRSNVRTVAKWCPKIGMLSRPVDYEKLDETIFLLSQNDSNYAQNVIDDSNWSTLQIAALGYGMEIDKYYHRYSSGYAAISGGEWSRVRGGSDPGSNTMSFLALSSSGQSPTYSNWYSTSLPYRPVFNL